MTPTSAVRLLVFAATTIATMACARSPERERIDFERMRIQQRYEPYAARSGFADGAAMQTPPVGAIAQETASDSGVLGTGMSGGQYATTVPVSLTPDRLALGREKFVIYCAVCHGDGAFGGSIVAENMGQPRPPSLRSDSVVRRPAGYLFSIATHGIGRMPAYAPQLTASERWAVVGYLQQLQHSPVATAEQRADSLRAIEIRRIDSALAHGRGR